MRHVLELTTLFRELRPRSKKEVCFNLRAISISLVAVAIGKSLHMSQVNLTARTCGKVGHSPDLDGYVIRTSPVSHCPIEKCALWLIEFTTSY